MATSLRDAAEMRSAIRRPPQQRRSRASLEWILKATEIQLIVRGNDSFTLADAADAAGVSTGSIYGKFQSKRDLVRAVQLRVQARLWKAQASAISRALKECSSVQELIGGSIDALAQTLRAEASIIRSLMYCASTDDVIGAAGRRTFYQAEAAFCHALLQRREEMTHPDPPRAVHSVFAIVYAAIGRQLGFGSTTSAVSETCWRTLIPDLTEMVVGFLCHRRAEAS